MTRIIKGEMKYKNEHKYALLVFLHRLYCHHIRDAHESSRSNAVEKEGFSGLPFTMYYPRSMYTFFEEWSKFDESLVLRMI